MPPPALDDYLTPREVWDATRVVLVAPIAFDEPWNEFEQEDANAPDV
jgi:hypothetical protein